MATFTNQSALKIIYSQPPLNSAVLILQKLRMAQNITVDPETSKSYQHFRKSFLQFFSKTSSLEKEDPFIAHLSNALNPQAETTTLNESFNYAINSDSLKPQRDLIIFILGYKPSVNILNSPFFARPEIAKSAKNGYESDDLTSYSHLYGKNRLLHEDCIKSLLLEAFKHLKNK